MAHFSLGSDSERAGSLVDQLETLIKRAERILGQVETSFASTPDRARASVAVIRELRSLLELLARLTGELDTRPQVTTTNIQSSPDWLALRGAILAALERHPVARADVLAALAGRAVPEVIDHD